MRPIFATSANPFSDSTGLISCDLVPARPGIAARKLRQFQAGVSALGREWVSLELSVRRILDFRTLGLVAVLCFGFGFLAWSRVQEVKGFRTVRRLDRTLAMHAQTNRLARLQARVELAWNQKEQMSIPEPTERPRVILAAHFAVPPQSGLASGAQVGKTQAPAVRSARPKTATVASGRASGKRVPVSSSRSARTGPRR